MTTAVRRGFSLCLLVLLPAFLPAQNKIDFKPVLSAEQLRRGVQAFHRGLYNDAWTALEKAVSYRPDDPRAMTWLGRSQWKAGYEQEALRTWQQLARMGKSSALVDEWVRVLQQRRGLGRELTGTATWVVASELDGTRGGTTMFKRPTSVRPRPDGSFWVVSFGSNAVLRFDANFRLLDTFRGGLEGFDHPWDVAESADGTLFVSEYGANRIAKVNGRGDKVAVFGRTGRADGLLLGPQYLALDSRDSLWVTDWGNSRVVRFALDGTFMQAITGIEGPTGIAAHEDRLYVSEKANKRVLVYDLNGNALGTLGEGTLDAPEGISFSPRGRLLVADGNRILECDPESEVWTVRGDTSAHTKRLLLQSVSPNGQLYGVDFDSSKVVLLADTTALYAGLVVRVDRVNAVKFPDVYADVSVENRFGRPVVGLNLDNFIVTEGHAPVAASAIALRNTDVRSIDVSLLVERSPGIQPFDAALSNAVEDLYRLVTATGRIKSISAAERPTREADFGETRLRFVTQTLRGAPTPRWRFDVAARMAGDELVTTVSGAKRSIVFMTTGDLGTTAFTTYSLTEIAAFLRNNAIAFSVVVVGRGAADENCQFLAAETGGAVYRLSDPGGMPQVVKDMVARLTPVYTLRFTSRSPAGFGDAYIPLEVEVSAQKITGRDESGYYAPPDTGVKKGTPEEGGHRARAE
jgi:DNA-binding beta-propeller fold protein YncE